MTLSFLRALAIGSALLVLAFGARGFKTPEYPPSPPQGYGVALGYQIGGQSELDALGQVWYLDYEFETPLYQSHPRLYFVTLTGNQSDIPRVARQHRGQWWTFGNEPNDPKQDNIPPSAYVKPYHDFYFGLKAADSQAHIIPTAVANADWRWLDEWRESYRAKYGTFPPVDGWRFHNYLLDTCQGATDVTEFRTRAIDFRNWVRQIGDDMKPVFMTEYGVLYGNGCCGCPLIPPAVVIEYMRATTLWLQQSQIVHAWSWFAAETDGQFNGDLFSNGELLPTGAAYRELVREGQ